MCSTQGDQNKQSDDIGFAMDVDGWKVNESTLGRPKEEGLTLKHSSILGILVTIG